MSDLTTDITATGALDLLDDDDKNVIFQSLSNTSAFSGSLASSGENFLGQILINAAAAAPPPPVAIVSPWGEAHPTLGQFNTVTITGTGGDDVLSGAPAFTDDVIDAGAGDDLVNGELGDDQLWGGTGVDRLVGDEGNDILAGFDGNDTLRGDQGDDILYGGLGRDRLYGGDGDDYISGNEDADIIYGGDGADIIYGGDGNDKIYGQEGDDEIHGGAGADRIYAHEGNNTIYGDADNDLIFSLNSTTVVYGGTGNDRLRGDVNNAFDDEMYGEDDDDILSGYGGDDYLDGGAGNDFIYAHEGNDTVYGRDGDDFILAREGNDTVYGGIGNDQISATTGTDQLYGEAGNDLINGGDDADTIDGGDDADTLIGAGGADTIDGGNGNDIIHGHGLDSIAIQAILTANPTVTYSKETNSFYQLVNSGGNPTWDSAMATASATTLSGVAGHLAVITSQTEHDYIVANVYDGDNAWLGGSDTKSEGYWRWDVGIEAGTDFWVGTTGGSAVNNIYTEWDPSQPNDSAGTQDYIYLLNSNDQWADGLIQGGSGFVNIPDYIIEWEAGLFSDDNAADILSGGAGNDMIYGYGGNDTINGDAGVDIIYAGAGNDTVDGGTNSDDIYGGDGGDDLTGGDGNDNIFAGSQIRLEIPNTATIPSYGAGQDGQGGSTNLLDDGVGVELDGNNWQKIEVNYEVTANTVVEFDFRSTREAEISGIGFDNDDNISNNFTFKVYGTQNWGRTNYDNYDGSGDWIHYEIDVGSFFTGTFEWFTLVNDDDGGGTDGNAWFRNIVIHEGGDGANTLNGGAGLDELYGDAGIDTFVFESASAFVNTDIIHYFNHAEDIINISDLLTNWQDGHPQRGDINNYLQFTNSGDHTIVAVDTNGNSGGSNFVTIAEIYGANDLDADALYTNGQLIPM